MTRLEASPDGDVVFHFEPFQASAQFPSIAVRGHAVPSDFPVPGTVDRSHARAERGASEQEHVRAVAQAVTEIEAGAFEKVVLSRSEFWSTPLPPEAVFQAKCESYPDAFVYLFAHPEAGVWIGATPEVLLLQSGTSFETVALAGTKSDRTRPWSEKERHEQALVVDFIEHKLRSSLASHLEIAAAESIAYGPLQHLKSNIAFASEYPIQHWLEVLHPTPAVGGTPREAALNFIAAHENGQRGYYTGYLGLVHGDRAEFYVNLRCMQCFHDGYQVFAGGGIVKGSDPANEWKETQDKIDSIRTGFEGR